MQLSTIPHLGNKKSPLLWWRWLIKQRPKNLLTISDCQQLHQDWTACGGMSWSMEINLNYWDWGGGVRGWRRGRGLQGWGWKRMKGRMRLWSLWKLIPGLQILCLRWPAAEAASWHQWESQRTSVPRWPPPPSHGSFYWISERNVHKMTTVLLKTECGGNIGRVGGVRESDLGKWNESMALKVLAASACPQPSALSGNFLL